MADAAAAAASPPSPTCEASPRDITGAVSGSSGSSSNNNNNNTVSSDPSASPPLPPSSDPPPPPTAPAAPTNKPNESGAPPPPPPLPPPSSAQPSLNAPTRPPHPRSCVTCRKRKVKCDKLWPCHHCHRAHVACVFPRPGRAPRKSRRLLLLGEGEGEGGEKELRERVRRLEGVVRGLGVDVDVDLDLDGGGGLERQVEMGLLGGGAAEGDLGRGERDWYRSSFAAAAAPPRGTDEEFRSKTRWVEDQQKGRFENRFGRLVVNEGKSRYINNSFWANLSNEVEDLKGILNQSSDDEEDHLTASPGSGPHQQPPSNHHAFVFGFSSQNVELLALHPLPGQIEDYWDIYKDRVDPLCKILHVPTLDGTILSASSHLANLSRGFECLLFAIYYGAITSLSAQDCLIKLGEEKPILLARYRFAIEQALARANFLTTEEIVVLQAFVIFLICLRRNSDARVIWTLTGLIVRIAQTIGIHRDGSHFGLSPFEVEMRRRLWWQVCILDTRASEDHGCDPTIVEQSFDTKLPLNINDEDMTPDMKAFPPERQGCTIMSFCLLRFEVANTFRRLNYIPPGPPKPHHDHYRTVTLQDKERWITECHKRLEERYLKHCDMSVPLFWVTATVARLMMSKMWLMVYHPFQRQDGGASLSTEVKEKLFITSLENMEYSLLLESEARTMKWGWLFKTYIQWHALAFTLSELCHRTTGDMVDRAWRAVDRTVNGRWGLQFSDETNTGHLWRPLKKLYRKAKDARVKGIQGEQLLKHRQGSAPVRHYSPNANPMFGHPHRPTMTRAPLSSAQLQRFHQGPTFGQAPLDKHELLRSPNMTGPGAGAPLDTVDVNAEMLDLAWQPDLDTDHAFNGLSSSTTAVPLAAPVAQQNYPHELTFATNFLSAGPGITFDDPGTGHSATSPNTNLTNAQPQASPPGTGHHLRMHSRDPIDNDHAIMDASGNLDWENWDHLVRQFGMDIDSSAGDFSAAAHTNPSDVPWDVAAQNANLKGGFGMSGGEWF